MTFVAGPENDRTPTGATPEEAAHVLLEAGADIVGANCGRGLAGMADICRRLRVATSRPVWVKPSAGLPRKIGGVLTYPISPEEFADLVPAMIRAGAGFVGGCCGTNADYIRAIVAKRKSWYQDPIGQR
jgi:methionine synthase I (cobalamin-dependent)